MDLLVIYSIIIGYLLLTLGSGLIGFRKAAASADDYFLAGRSLGKVVIFFTFIATNFSAFFFLGFAGEGYRTGYAYFAMIAFGTSFASLFFYLIGKPAWELGRKSGYITAPELIGSETGSPLLRNVFVLVMVVFTLPYMAIQPIGAGIILETLTQGQIPYMAGCTLLTAFMVFYVFLGGMRSIAITDMIQGVLMFALIFVAVGIVTGAFGGFAEANKQVYEIKPELFAPSGNGAFDLPKWISLILLWLFCVPMFPQMFMRFFVARDVSSLKTASFFYALVPLVLFIAPVTIGMVGHLSFPDLQGKAADNVLPAMLQQHASPALFALIMTGALAAFMSTMDSQLLALSTILTRDVLGFGSTSADMGAETTAGAGFRREIRIGRLLVVLLALLALLIAWWQPGAIFTIAKNAFSGLAILFPACLAALRFREKFHPTAAAIGIIVGEIFLLLTIIGLLPPNLFFGLEPYLPACALATVAIIIGALMRKTR